MALHPPYRVLIVGCGNIASGFDEDREPGAPPLSHAGALTGDDRYVLAACVDPDAERLHTVMARWQVLAGHASLDDLEPAAQFDIVVICSPTALHPAHLDAALRLRPALIFCEKPVTPDLALSEALVARCEAQGVLLAVNHTRRWAPDVVRLREDLAAGKWGSLRAVSATYNKGVVNNGSHLIDLLHFLLDRRLDLVAAGAPLFDFWPEDPTIPAMLVTDDGLPIQLGIAHAGDFSLFELQIVTSLGVIAMLDGGASWQFRKVINNPDFKGYHSLDTGERRSGELAYAMVQAYGNIVDALTTGAPLASTGRSALAAQQLCEQIRTAAFADRGQGSA